jgi:hypothetical protein
MSFSLTTPQFRARQKDVTRRYGWWDLEPGDVLSAVEKAMGLKKGEKAVPLGPIGIVTARAEPLRRMIDEPEYGAVEVIREGFPNITPAQFVEMLCKHSGKAPEDPVNRIHFKPRPYFTLAVGDIVPSRPLMPWLLDPRDCPVGDPIGGYCVYTSAIQADERANLWVLAPSAQSDSRAMPKFIRHVCAIAPATQVATKDAVTVWERIE